MKTQLTQTETTSIDAPPAWSGVFALALGAFVLVASEFMPVSLLTPIARELHITEGQAGEAIAVSGAFALITSLSISSVVRTLDRKSLLLGLTMLMMVSGTVVAFAPNYWTFMAGRALIGIAIGGFWSMSAATAMRLVPSDQVPRALAIVNGGNALATVLAAPLGSFLGGIIGWRGAFFCVVPVAAIALGWKMISLPAMRNSHQQKPANIFGLLTRLPILVGMIAVSIFFMGQFTLFTYLRPFLETVTHAGVSTLTLILFIIGLAGLAGTFLIGRFLERSLYPTLKIIPAVMAAIAIALTHFGNSVLITATLLGVWGLIGTAAPVAWWTWMARTLPNDAEAGGGLMVATVQLAIMSGATVGGMLYDASGYQSTFYTSASILVLASLLAALTAWAAQRKATPVQRPLKALRTLADRVPGLSSLEQTTNT